MHRLLDTVSKYKWLILGVAVILILSFLYNKYINHFRYHLKAKFKTSSPLYKNMPVFFKGYKIGKIQKVILSDDYKYTTIEILLYPKNPKLPKDTVAVVKNHNLIKNYIDLSTSDEEPEVYLKSGDIIEGEPLVDIESFVSEIANSGLLVPLIQNFSDTAVSLNKTSTEIEGFFADSRSVLNDNKTNLKSSTNDLAKTTQSLNSLASRLNTSISDEKVDNTTISIDKSAANIQAATENIKSITQSVDCATRNLDKTIAKIDSTMAEANGVASNARVITGGFCEVMGKRFAGLRIFFGKPLNRGSCCKKCGQ